MYHTYYQRPRRKGTFLPFLSLIILGLIVILVFQIVDYFQEKRLQALQNKAAVQVLAGRADLKIWGVEAWADALTGSILHEGDAIRTMPGSRVVLSLLNGSVIRLSSETEVELAELKSRDGQDEIALRLKNGEIWLKRSEKEEVKASFKVETNHLEVTSLGTIFNVAATTRESVQVIDGKVQVAIRVEEPGDVSQMRLAETTEVALGQEISLGQDDIIALQNRRSIPLLALLSDSFRESDWYRWNRAEDSSATPGLTVAEAVNSGAGTTTLSLSQRAPEPEEAPRELVEELTPPVITNPPPAQSIIKHSTLVITATVSSQTAKIEATTYLGGKPETYILNKYVPGAKTFNYVASRELGNLVPGENHYSFVAIARDGARSEPTELRITFDQPKSPVDLAAPQVVSFNGQQSNEVTVGSVLVEGTVGKGIVKVFINGFALTRYVPDSGRWSYYAKTEYKNFNEGENRYEVYGLSYDGRSTPITVFIIIKKPSEAVAPPGGAATATP